MSLVNAKKFGKYTIELHIILLLVFFAFFSMLKLLDMLFPEGTSLNNLVHQVDIFTPTDKRNSLGKNIIVELNGETQELNAQIVVVATIKSIENTVKSKPAGKIAWKRATTGLSLYNRDALQTFSRSSAAIQFDRKNIMHLGENSLIIIKQIKHDFMTSKRHARLILSTGVLHGEIRATRKSTMGMEVITGDISTSVTSVKPNKPVDFKVKINPDKSSTITVFKGQAKVSMLGKSVQVHSNQAVTLATGDAIPDPVTPIKAIRTIAPKYKGIFKYHDIPRQVKFIWQHARNADGYQIIIARDHNFKDIVVKERLKKTYFTHSNLKEGVYFWKVRGLIGWVEGVYSKINTFIVIKDVKPPSLHVNMPPDVIHSNIYKITGITDRRVKIFINGVPVHILANGTFKYKIKLVTGSNVIVVESIDVAGNVNYNTKLVTVIGK